MDLKVHIQANHVASTDSIVQTVDTGSTAEEADTIAWCLRWLFIEQVVHRQEDVVGTASFTGKVIPEGEVGNEHGINRVVILFTRGAEPVLGPTVDVLAVQEGPEVVAPVGQVGQEAVGGIGTVQEIPWCTWDQLRSLIDVIAEQAPAKALVTAKEADIRGVAHFQVEALQAQLIKVEVDRGDPRDLAGFRAAFDQITQFLRTREAVVDDILERRLCHGTINLDVIPVTGDGETGQPAGLVHGAKSQGISLFRIHVGVAGISAGSEDEGVAQEWVNYRCTTGGFVKTLPQGRGSYVTGAGGPESEVIIDLPAQTHFPGFDAAGNPCSPRNGMPCWHPVAGSVERRRSAGH